MTRPDRAAIVAASLLALVGLGAAPTPKAPPVPSGSLGAVPPAAGTSRSIPTTPAGRATVLAEEVGALLAAGQLAAAEAKATQALTLDAKNAEANYQMARIRFLKGDQPGALRAVNTTLAANGQHVGALFALVRISAAQGRPAAPYSRVLSEATKRRDDLGLLLVLGEAQLTARKFPAALATATRVLQQAETSVAAMKLLARVYLGMGRPVTAASILDRALELERDAEALTLLAGIRMREDKLLEARVLLEEAIDKEPNYVEALNSLGVVYIRVSNWSGASQVLNKSIVNAPAFASAWTNLGSAQRGAGQFGPAEASWKRVLSIVPKDAGAWFNLGVLYLENPLPGRDRIKQLTDSINAFNAYKRNLNSNERADTETEKYIGEARLLLKQERDRRKEELKTPEGDGDDSPTLL